LRGQVAFSPRSETEFQLYQYLLDKYATDHVSAERVISRQGIVAIYQFLRDTPAHAESPAVGEVVRNWERCETPCDGSSDPAATIATAASEGKDEISTRTMQIFVSAYGAEAGDLALKTLPYGGFYIAGGIAVKNVSLLSSQEFMQAFRQKGRVSQLLMAGRSLRLSATGQQQARRALLLQNLTQKAIANEQVIASWSTVNRFFNGKPVDRFIFQEICQVLELDWQEVAAREDLGRWGEKFPTLRTQVSRTLPSIPPSPHSLTPLFTAVQTQATAAREALNLRILERIPRKVVRAKYLEAIARGT
jgi:Tfp pilus assembly protein PilV